MCGLSMKKFLTCNGPTGRPARAEQRESEREVGCVVWTCPRTSRPHAHSPEDPFREAAVRHVPSREMGDLAASIDQCLKNRSRASTKRWAAMLFTLLILMDLVNVFLLREAPKLLAPPGANASDDGSFVWMVAEGTTEEDYEVSWTWHELLKQIPNFAGDTADCCLLLVVRLIVFFILVRVGVLVGTPDLRNIDASSVAPLLINQGDGQLHQLASEAKASHLESFDRKKRAEVKKNAVSGVLFLLSTSAQIFLGVKVISFHGHWEDPDVGERIKTMQGILFFASVLLINFEAFLANRLINTLCSEEGFYVPEFHQHRLFFHVVDGHVCDMCHNRTRHPSPALPCWLRAFSRRACNDDCASSDTSCLSSVSPEP